MSVRGSNSSLNAGTFSPKKYNQYTVTYADLGGGAYTATYRYYGTPDDTNTLLATVEIEYDTEGRDIRGELLDV